MNDGYGIDVAQFRRLVVRPALNHIGLWSAAAENLVLGTAMHESLLIWIKQISGPALGVFQMEPATHRDIHESFLRYKRELQRSVLSTAAPFPGDFPDSSELVWNLRYAAAMCRIHYLRVPAPLPRENDAYALTEYWKRHYNTVAGKGTIEQALPHFNAASRLM